MGPLPQKLDHVALNVSDASAAAALVLAQLPFRVLEETDEFVLVGRDPLLGKLTLFHAEGPREAGVLRKIGIGIPGGTAELDLELGDGLQLGLTPTDPGGEVEVTLVRLLAPDPAASAGSDSGWSRRRRARTEPSASGSAVSTSSSSQAPRRRPSARC